MQPGETTDHFTGEEPRSACDQLDAVCEGRDAAVLVKVSSLADLIDRSNFTREGRQSLIDGVIVQLKIPQPKSILQDWVQSLGLRHQGALLGAIRGCDGAPRDDVSKPVIRCIRGTLLHAHCGDVAKAATFMESVPAAELIRRFDAFRRNMDHLPMHFVVHVLQAVEIIGYKHPQEAVQAHWYGFYRKLCQKLHMNHETEQELDARLNADEETFGAVDRA